MTHEPKPYVILNETDEVINVVLWDGVSEWELGPGLRAVLEADYLVPPENPNE